MRPLLYALPGCEALAAALAGELAGDLGELEVRRFPDAEHYVRLLTAPAGRPVVFVCGLDRPDEKIMPLYFAACAARELGAARVGLVAPYLGYMRQDAVFKPGESVTSAHFARWLSQFLDWLVTVDPHLHRHDSLDRIYSVPTIAATAAPAIARWLSANVRDPLVVGPDAESVQWVRAIARDIGCPFVVAEKERRGDRDVTVTLPDVERWHGCTPVLVDDIVSTARTMIDAVARLRASGMSARPLCIGVHALFVGNAHAELAAAGVDRIVTCNTVTHASNAIDVLPQIAEAAQRMLARSR